MIIVYYITFIFLLLLSNNQRSEAAQCQNISSKKVHCHEFTTWSILTSLAVFNSSLSWIELDLQPSASLLLTKELDTPRLGLSEFGNLNLYSIKGLNVYPWDNLTNTSNLNIYIHLSTIEFYVNEKPPTEYTCHRDLLPEFNKTSSSIFASYAIEKITFLLSNTFSSSLVCPYLFKYALLALVGLEGQVDSFLFTNLLRFNQVNDTETINSNISKLIINGYDYKLDTGLLHPLVFKTTNDFEFYGTISSIKTNLFKHFNQLNQIKLYLDSVGNFYHTVGAEWMAYLARGSVLSVLPLEGEYEPTLYTYPDRDLCLFASFPQNKSLYISLYAHDGGYRTLNNCTSTLKWLGRNFYNNASADSNNVYTSCSWPNSTGLNDTQIDEKLQICNFTNQTFKANWPIYPDFYEARLVNIFIVQLIPFVLIPLACLIGLFLNKMIIQTIQKNKNKELKEDFYKYMSANAKFNCIYCLIFVFYPMTSCNWRPSYYFCSILFTSSFAQYYKIVVMAYFGEVLKMCANISYLMMTVNRYLLVGKDHAPWLVTIAKLELKWVIRGSFLFSALINIGHGFEYQATEDWLFSPLRNDFYYNFVTYNLYIDYPAPNVGQAFFYFTIVYFAINFLAFFVLNTVVEVKLVRRMHKEMKEKRERMAKMNATGAVSSDGSANQQDKNKKKEEEDEKKERRVVKMVVLNGIFNFVLRVPDLFVVMENEAFWTSIRALGYLGILEVGFKSIFADIGYFTYILSFSTNFLIFYYFNSKFKEAVIFISEKKKRSK